MSAVVESVFSPAERAELVGASESDRVLRFFRGCTRKEALAKAAGMGVGSLGRFSASLAALRATIHAIDGAPPHDWRLRELHLLGPLVGAVAVQSSEANVVLRPWDLR